MRSLRSISLGLILGMAAGPVQAAPVRYRDVVFGATTVSEGIVYDAAHGLALDIYEPVDDTATGRAAIVLAHGGGFTSGSRDQMRTIAEAYALYGYVTVSISYRLDPDLGYEELIIGSLAGEMPEAMRNAQLDMQAAVRWLRTNAAAWRVDPDLIMAGGVSAGASMSLETAFNPEDDGDDGPVPSDIAAVISLSGATDPRRIEAGAPPVTMYNGVLDTTAPFVTAVLAYTGASAQGNTIELTAYAMDGHDLSARTYEIIADSALFVCAHVLGCA